MSSLLDVRGLAAGYDGALAIRDVTMSVNAGEVVALLGANGAGKTTTLLAMSGLLRPMAGTTRLSGEDITRRAPHRIASWGLALVPEARALARSLTVAENLRLVGQHRADPYDLFPELGRLRDRPAGLLSGGEQQMLAVARALSMGPRVLLIDELSLGLGPIVVHRLLQALRERATASGLGVLLVEQHVTQALEVADRAYVLSRGRMTAEGNAATLLADRRVVESSYLGDVAQTPRPEPEAATTTIRSRPHAP